MGIIKNHNELIPVAEPVFTDEEATAVYDVIKSGWVTMGERVAAFERDFAIYAKSNHAIAMFNGTTTLHAALMALDIKPGDEIITPTLTYISTANVALYLGAKLILCECNPETYNVEVENLEHLVSSKTKAIIVVDMNGLPVNYNDLVRFAKRHKIAIIADSAESLGAVYNGEIVGSQADLHSFSFFGNKNVTTGEGGMVTTNDDGLADRLRIIRNQGQDFRYNHVMLGHNFRMTELQAALGIVQLKTLEDRLRKKERIVEKYNNFFGRSEFSGILRTPVIPEYVTRHSWYMYTLDLNIKVNRDLLADELLEAGIETRKSFPPVHIQPYHSKLLGTSALDFPASYNSWCKLINLPISPNLTDVQIEFITKTVERLIIKQVNV